RVRWNHVADWLRECQYQSPVSVHLADQFVEFLKLRGMTMEKVGSQLPAGVRSLQSLLFMIEEMANKLDLKPKLVPEFKASKPNIGFHLLDGKYWIGLYLVEPQIVELCTWAFKGDYEKANSLGLAEHVEPCRRAWQKLTNSEFLFTKRLDLECQ